ncbi:hypothetical protein JCM3765_002973 [Sporobolomyces pararoseus]
MAKKAGRTAAEPTATTPVPQRDALQRLSYLYQASVLFNNISLDRPARLNKRRKVDRATEKEQAEGHEPSARGKQHNREGRDQDQLDGKQDGDSAQQDTATARNARRISRKLEKRAKKRGEDVLKPISQHLLRTMQDVAKKATVRMDPAVKRSVCKSCDVVLIPGISSSVRIKASGPHAHLSKTRKRKRP